MVSRGGDWGGGGAGGACRAFPEKTTSYSNVAHHNLNLRWGVFVSEHPVMTMISCFLLTLLFGVGLIKIRCDTTLTH